MTLEQICTVSKVSMLNDRFRERGLGIVLTGGSSIGSGFERIDERYSKV